MRSVLRPNVIIAVVALIAGVATPALAADWPSATPTGLALSLG